MSEFDVQHNLTDFDRKLRQLPTLVISYINRQIKPKAVAHASKLFSRIVRTWQHRPIFRVRATSRGSYEIRIKGGTTDPVFGFLDQGTRPHIIEPKGPGYPLRFREGYNAKTIPSVLLSRSGGPTGGTVYAYRVHHPGTKARKFSEGVARDTIREIQRILPKVLQKAMRRWAHIIRK